jgi:hypothetical protein
VYCNVTYFTEEVPPVSESGSVASLTVFQEKRRRLLSYNCMVIFCTVIAGDLIVYELFQS